MAKVLHIDDSPVLLSNVSKFFCANNPGIESGKESLDLISHHYTGEEVPRSLLVPPPDALILDYNWGYGANGVDFARKMRAGGYNKPIILFSLTDESDIKRFHNDFDRLGLVLVDKAYGPRALYSVVQKNISDYKTVKVPPL